MSVFQVFTKAAPNHMENFIQQIIQLNKQKNYEDAISLCRNVLKIDQNNGYIYGLCGNAQRKLGLLDEAIESYQQAITHAPNHGCFHVFLAEILRERGDITQSNIVLKEAMEIDSKNPDIYRHLGNIFRELGDDKTAIWHYQHAIKLAPKRVDLMINLGTALRRTGRQKDASDVFRQAQKLAPDDAFITQSLAELDTGIRGQSQKATSKVPQTLTKKPLSPASAKSLELKQPQSPLINFLIMGTQKGGTTALTQFLGAHPQVCLPEAKEVHYFDTDENFRFSPTDYGIYHRFFPHSHHLKTYKAIGEATPNYMLMPQAIHRIKAYNPAIKLIFILRNPIKRAYSQWAMRVNAGQDARTFKEAIYQEVEQLKAGITYNPKSTNQFPGYIDRGFYAKQLKFIRQHFSQKQMIVLRNEDLKTDQKQTMRQIFNFLHIGHIEIESESDPIFSHIAPAMSETDQAYLLGLYQKDISELEVLLGWDCSDWKSMGAIQQTYMAQRRSSTFAETGGKKDIEEAFAHILKGNRLRNQGDREAALSCYRRALDFDIYDSETPFQLGKFFLEEGELDEALAIFERAKARQAPISYSGFYSRLAELLLQQKRTKDAKRFCQHLIKLKPNSNEFRRLIAKTEAESGNYTAAIAHYQHIIDAGSSTIHVYQSLAKLLLEQNQPVESKAILEKALSLDPIHPDIHRLLGDIHRQSGDNQAAIEHYKEAIE
ncbi:MAG: tetratricopeptide repeat protein, partial [Chloroflexota bacterium]